MGELVGLLSSSVGVTAVKYCRSLLLKMIPGKRTLYWAAFAFVFVLALTSVTLRAEDADDEDSDVVELTVDDFDGFIKKHPTTLVEFYAPWCGHCKSLKPEYDAAAAQLKAAKSTIPLAKVDATAETELATRFEVKGYPTLKFFKNGKPLDYTGGRKADAIVQWITSMSGPAVHKIEEKDAKAPERGALFVARYTSETSDAAKLFSNVAEKLLLTAQFSGIISDKAADDVTVYRIGEPTITVPIGKDMDKLEKWMSAEKFPLFGPIDGENYGAYEERGREIVWFASTPEDFTTHAAAFRKAATDLSQYSFVWLDTEKFGSHAENGLGIATFPGMVLKITSGSRFIYPGKTFAADELIQFLKDASAGKIEAFIKSEPIPETNDAAVKVVVGKNFEDLVFQDEKDVLLEIYAPWCGHCKRLEPIYTEFAEKLAAKHDHIVVAKMDGTANEPSAPDFAFRGFPTLFWVKAGEKTPVTYNEERTLEGLLKFVKENSSKPVTVELETEEKKEEKEEEKKDEL